MNSLRKRTRSWKSSLVNSKALMKDTQTVWYCAKSASFNSFTIKLKRYLCPFSTLNTKAISLNAKKIFRIESNRIILMIDGIPLSWKDANPDLIITCTAWDNSSKRSVDNKAWSWYKSSVSDWRGSAMQQKRMIFYCQLWMAAITQRLPTIRHGLEKFIWKHTAIHLNSIQFDSNQREIDR